MAFGQYLGYVAGVVCAIIGGVIGSYVPGVGTAYGATLGFSVGSLVGGIAGELFWPERADKPSSPPPPQPHETRLQISSWGAPIPIQYGSGRMAGNIIYMSDIKETLNTTTWKDDQLRYHEYNKIYTATFAIAFCEGEISGISRIWVNNKVFADFRDPYGEYYPAGGYALAYANLDTSIARGSVYFSIYLGTSLQTADPKISGLITDAENPAYKDLAYIVFKDFPIGEYGGIPNIEVEIGDQYEPEDFTTWNWTPSSRIAVSEHEVQQIVTWEGSSVGTSIFYPTSRTFSNFRMVSEWELISLKAPVTLASYNYSTMIVANYSAPANSAQIGIVSDGSGGYKFMLYMYVGSTTKTSYSAAYMTLPLKRMLSLLRIGTTLTLTIYNGDTIEETLSVTDSSFTHTDLGGLKISTLFQTGAPAISFYVRSLYITDI